MPNHVHLLISEPKKGTPSTVLQMLKQRVSRKMRKGRCRTAKAQLTLAFPKFIAELPQFWQPRFYDFNVYSHKKKKEKLEYMHANPTNRRLVRHPKDWPWSSFSFYAKDEAGLVEIDLVKM
jgi:putative transposase